MKSKHQIDLEKKVKAYADMYWDQLDNTREGMLDAVESINSNEVIGKGKTRQLAVDYDEAEVLAAYVAGLADGKAGFEAFDWEA